MRNQLVPSPALMQSVAIAHSRIEAEGQRVTPNRLIDETLQALPVFGAQGDAARYGVELAVLGYQAELTLARGET